MKYKIWLLLVTGGLFTGLVFAQMESRIWLEMAQAFFENHCELVDSERLEGDQTAYYLTCIW